MMNESGPTHSRALPVGLVILAVLLGGAGWLLRRTEREHQRAREEAGARLATEASAFVREVQGALATEATRAARIRPFRAAVEHDLDPETFRDLLNNEEWWGPFRERAALVMGGSGGNIPFGPDATALADRALVDRAAPDHPALGWAADGGRPMVAAAIQVLVGQGPRRVLVLGRPLDRELLQRMAGSIGAALWLSDGRSVDLFVGPEALRAAADALVGNETGGAAAGRTWIAAPMALAPGRWLWAVRESPGGGAPGLLGLALLALAAATGTGGALLALRRRPAPAPTPASSGARVGETEAAHSRASSFHPTLIAAGSTQTFGRYTLVERIGEGGMSELFTAVLTGAEGFQRLFVIKRLRPELAHNKSAVDQFIDEAKLGAQLVHSNIVPTFDFGKVGGGYYLAQEYISGRNLAEFCDRHRERLHEALGPALTCYIAHEVLEALAYAHARTNDQGEPLHIVHRDVSTGNVMVTAQGEVKLLDFGIVRASGRVASTDIGQVKGNATFMAPEQARGQPVDGRADLFSLGMVMYYGLTGRPLYDSATPALAFYQATIGLTADHLALVRALPEPLPGILETALSLDPARRYPHAQAFALALAPHVVGMKAELATLMNALFGEDLRRQTASFRAKLLTNARLHAG